MFTGIVEHVGSLVSVKDQAENKRLSFAASDLHDLPIGGSVAVNGVCLTAVEVESAEVGFDVTPETLRRSSLGQLREGSKVNLERPMRADGRFDGHIVQGHVDGMGTVMSVGHGEEGTTLTVSLADDLAPYLVEKGSITVDGVSLTIAELREGSFRVALIPHTLKVTNLGLRREGHRVNLEVDVLARYVERLLETRQ